MRGATAKCSVARIHTFTSCSRISLPPQYTTAFCKIPSDYAVVKVRTA